MKNQFIHIKVPASTSNIGPGFDSIGIALNLYLTIDCFPHNEWLFNQKNKENSSLPTGKENMLFQSAIFVAKKFGISSLSPFRVDVTSEIPLARGLGSSGAATVAGIEIANQLLHLNLTLKEKVKLAAEIEGHPDNVAPSIIGGCVVAYYKDKNLYFIEKKGLRNVDFIAMIPNYELKTKEARDVLPEVMPYFRSIEGSAIGNVCTAALFSENYTLLGEVMEKEVFHQTYRKKFIPHFDELTEFMRDEGAYGTFLSGAGPTMISICKKGLANEKLNKWQERFPDSEWKILNVDNHGIKVDVKESLGTYS